MIQAPESQSYLALGGGTLKKILARTLMIAIILCVFTTASFAADVPSTAFHVEPVISVVIPLKYGPIELVNADLFVTSKDPADFTSNARKNLYDFTGKLLMEGMQDISFSGKWIIVNKGGKFGVYSHDMTNPVPCLYSRVAMMDETHCEVIDGTLNVRPGIWFGNRYRYDLTTGVIVEELGYGAEASPSWGLYSPVKRLADAAGSAGITLVKTGGKENTSGIEAGAVFKAYNKAGQLLLDFTPYCGTGFNDLTYGSAGRLFFGYADDGNDKQGAPNYVFSGRGRLIAWQRGAGYQGMYGGNYICAYGNPVYGTKPAILDWNGDTVIAGGVYDSYQFNNDGTWTPVSDNRSHVIVSKDGMYGVITLSDSVAEPSAWARAEVSGAVRKSLVPDDVKGWWKDSCTRLEFCRMLALTLEEMTGSSVAELSAESMAVGFSDCSEPDVLAVASLGITKGTGNGRFAPYSFISREQAAVMLARTAEYLKIQATGTGISFADSAQFSEWSVAEIEAVSTILCGIGRTPLLQGSGNALFSPGHYATVEQAAAAMSRLTEVIR
jgi:hypothetical protein